MQFVLTNKAQKAVLQEIHLSLGERYSIDLPFEIKPGETVVGDESNTVKLYDKSGVLLNTTKVAESFFLEAGKHKFQMSTRFSGAEEPEVAVTIKQLGEPELLQSK